MQAGVFDKRVFRKKLYFLNWLQPVRSKNIQTMILLHDPDPNCFINIFERQHLWAK